MNLKIKRLDPDLPLPAYATEQSSGLDLYSTENRVIAPGESALIPAGVAVEIPAHHEGQVRPRSSITRRCLILPTGTIDADYRGEIAIVLINAGREVQHISRGDRIAQLVIAPVARCWVEVVEELGDTERGAEGFGSTGR